MDKIHIDLFYNIIFFIHIDLLIGVFYLRSKLMPNVFQVILSYILPSLCSFKYKELTWA